MGAFTQIFFSTNLPFDPALILESKKHIFIIKGVLFPLKLTKLIIKKKKCVCKIKFNKGYRQKLSFGKKELWATKDKKGVSKFQIK